MEAERQKATRNEREREGKMKRERGRERDLNNLENEAIPLLISTTGADRAFPRYEQKHWRPQPSPMSSGTLEERPYIPFPCSSAVVSPGNLSATYVWYPSIRTLGHARMSTYRVGYSESKIDCPSRVE